MANASASVQEPGIARFDVLQDNDDPTHFVLVEIYRTQEATVAHKETAHYAAWRDAVRADDGAAADRREVRLRLRHGSRVGKIGIDRGFGG
jgi:quinol monooxygenase YgiN